jgi:hypothetical protein
MNETEQEIWKRCLSGIYLKKKIHFYLGYSFVTINFQGEFELNSPIYHCYFYGHHYIHQKDHRGWVIKTHQDNWYSSRQEENNDHKFPRSFHPYDKVGESMKEFFGQIEQKMMFCNHPSDKIIQFLTKYLPFPIEVLWMICSNIRICELEWLEKQLLKEKEEIEN